MFFNVSGDSNAQLGLRTPGLGEPQFVTSALIGRVLAEDVASALLHGDLFQC